MSNSKHAAKIRAYLDRAAKADKRQWSYTYGSDKYFREADTARKWRERAAKLAAKGS